MAIANGVHLPGVHHLERAIKGVESGWPGFARIIRILNDAEISKLRSMANLSCRQYPHVGRVAYPTMRNDDLARYLRLVEIPTAKEGSPGINIFDRGKESFAGALRVSGRWFVRQPADHHDKR